MRPRADIAAACLAIAAGLAIALPPEVHPESGPALALLLAAGLLACGTLSRLGPVLAAFGLALFNVAASFAPGRTAETLMRATLAAAAFYLAVRVARDQRRWALAALAAAGAGLGALALVQRAGLLASEAATARELGLAAEVVTRLEANRAFGTHAVPSSLAGALVIALAAVGALLATGTRRWPAYAAAALAAAGLVATASFGGLVGLAAGALVLVAGRPHARRWLAVTVAGALAACALFAALRPVPAFDLGRPDNPLVLRAGNWRGAALAALRGPFAGTGLGSFGALYPAVRRAGDSETLYAHNSWLQLAAEGGIPALALLAAAAVLLARRARATILPEARWALAGTVAFAAQNLFDFTAYLPGIAVPAALMAASAFRDRPPEPSAGRRLLARDRLGATALAGALLVMAVMWSGEALVRRALERAAASPSPAAAVDVLRAATLAPWSPTLGLRAGRLALAAGDARGAARMAEHLARIDPESPAPRHLMADARLEQKQPADAWRAYGRALERHPADAEIRHEMEAVEAALRAGGLGQQPLEYGGEALPPERPWRGWEQALLLAGAALALGVVARWLQGGAAAGEALAMALLLLYVAWGEGGALPGARLGRQLILVAGLLALLFPVGRIAVLHPLLRRGPGHAVRAPGGGGLREAGRRALRWPRVVHVAGGRGEIPRGPLLAVVPAAAWAAGSAALAPDRAGARDGLLALVAALCLVPLSWGLARRSVRWPRAALVLFAVSASALALLWCAQQVAIWAGLDLSAAAAPFRVPLGRRPAADFLHAGHLGSFLLAAGLGVVAAALAGARSRALASWGALLAVLGLAQGARATFVGLLVAGLALGWCGAHSARARRAMLAVLVAGAIVGAAGMALRFSTGTPFAWSRLGIWGAATRAAVQRPWFGFGPGGFAALGPNYAFADPGSDPVSVYGRAFRGPHSDALGCVLGLGVPGALMLLAALGWLASVALRTARKRWGTEPFVAGATAAVAVLAGHALADDLFGERPATAVVAAILLGAAAGRRGSRIPAWRPSTPARFAIAVGVVTALFAGEVLPWAAYRLAATGAPVGAAALDPARAGFWIEAARAARGAPLPHLSLALDRTGRAVQAVPESAAAWAERALVLDAACRGPLAERDTCRAALRAWDEALERRPHDAIAMRHRARLALLTGRPREAGEGFERAVATEPNYLGARADLVRWLAEQGRLADSRAQFEELRRRAARLKDAPVTSGYDAALLTVTADEIARAQFAAAGSAGPAR
ncbi:MAG: O-antigen ligase family protein [Acidobacteria bacterium]|nr:O-antigen ligase family protein [Acidobacteriota bacterium]